MAIDSKMAKFIFVAILLIIFTNSLTMSNEAVNSTSTTAKIENTTALMGGYRTFDITSIPNLSDYCYAQSLRKAYQ